MLRAYSTIIWLAAISGAACFGQSSEVDLAVTKTLTDIQLQLIKIKDVYPQMALVNQSKIWKRGNLITFIYENGVEKQRTRHTRTAFSKFGCIIAFTIEYPVEMLGPQVPSFQVVFPDKTRLFGYEHIELESYIENADFRNGIQTVFNSEKNKLIDSLQKIGGRRVSPFDS